VKFDDCLIVYEERIGLNPFADGTNGSTGTYLYQYVVFVERHHMGIIKFTLCGWRHPISLVIGQGSSQFLVSFYEDVSSFLPSCLIFVEIILIKCQQSSIHAISFVFLSCFWGRQIILALFYELLSEKILRESYVLVYEVFLIMYRQWWAKLQLLRYKVT
jgi:hypothetical protein